MWAKNNSNKSNTKLGFSSAFTIVELLVVIVVIGILATITIISYTGISQKATISSIQSDLTNFSKQLKIFQVEKMLYPDTVSNCSTTPDSTTNKCLKLSGSNVIANYVRDNTITPQGFCLNITNGTLSYKITSTKYNVPTVGDCSPTTPVTQNFTATGAQSWPVINGITSVQLQCWGAKGGNGGNADLVGHSWTLIGGTGGLGGHIVGSLAVNLGETLNINIGSIGVSGSLLSLPHTSDGVASDGATGGNTTIIRSGTTLATCTGGSGGTGAWGEHLAGGVDGGDGATGVAGTATYSGLTSVTINSADAGNGGNGKVSITYSGMEY